MGERLFEAHVYEPWQVYLLLGLLALLTVVRFAYVRDLHELWVSFRNYNLANQFYRDWEASSSFPFFLLNIFFIAISSYCINEIGEAFGAWPENDFQSYILLVGILCVGFLGFYLLYQFVFLIFPFKSALRLYIYHTSVIMKVLGIAMVPVAILLTFLEGGGNIFLIWVGALVTSLFGLYRYIRGFMIAEKYLSFQKFHFLLYICTLEVAPVLIAIKAIEMQIQ